jgi:hypothetical protein
VQGRSRRGVNYAREVKLEQYEYIEDRSRGRKSTRPAATRDGYSNVARRRAGRSWPTSTCLGDILETAAWLDPCRWSLSTTIRKTHASHPWRSGGGGGRVDRAQKGGQTLSTVKGPDVVGTGVGAGRGAPGTSTSPLRLAATAAPSSPHRRSTLISLLIREPLPCRAHHEARMAACIAH